MQKPGFFCPYCMYIFPESVAEILQETGREVSDRDNLQKIHKLNKDFKRINHFERIKDFKLIKEYLCPVCGRSVSEYAPSPHHLQPGTVLRERYLLRAALGEGGYGITYTGFGLSLAEEKCMLIEFGHFAEENRKRRNEGKPETFYFFGFTHICSKTKGGKFKVRRETSRKKLLKKCKDIHRIIGRLEECVNRKPKISYSGLIRCSPAITITMTFSDTFPKS